MTIFVNSKPQQLPENASVLSLLKTIQATEKRVAIEVNTELVVRAEWPGFKLKEGDRVEVVTFVGGG